MKRLCLVFFSLLMTGCDLGLASQALPGLFWPVGRPLTGGVTDAVSGLPLGKATVLCGLGSVSSENNGRFSLYGALSSDAISVSRAGYTSVTLKRGTVQDGVQIALSPLFPNTGDMLARYAVLKGKLTDSDTVGFSDGTSGNPNNDGTFSLTLRGGLPGTMMSGVLACGKLEGGPMSVATASFHYASFGFEFMDVAFLDTPTAAEEAPISHDPPAPTTPMKSLTFQFSNQGSLNKLQAEATLDFGMRGEILVARQFSAGTPFKIPSLTGMIYALSGLAKNEAGTLQSLASITTNSPGDTVTFDLLSPPTPLSPSGKVGPTPTFSWSAVPKATLYVVKVFENANAQPKWIGYTNTNSIAYPDFPYGDLNGGALNLSGAKYTWTVTASDEGVGDSTTSAPPFRPFRKAYRESAARGMEFSR